MDIHNEVKNILHKEGFKTCEYFRGCFDIAAKRKDLFLIKSLYNIDSFQFYQSRDLKNLSYYISALPLIIGKRTRRENLEENILYERFGVTVLTPGTLRNILNGDYPKCMRFRGGFFGELDSKKMKEARLKKGLTQEELADKIKASKKNIYEHESGKRICRLDIIDKLEDVLDTDISDGLRFKQAVRSYNKPKNNLEKTIDRIMSNMGFDLTFLSRAPINMVAKDKDIIFSDMEDNFKILTRKLPVIKKFSDITDNPVFLFSEKIIEKEFKGLPVLRKEEISEFKDAKELLKEIKQRGSMG